jgi:hypothetical protein
MDFFMTGSTYRFDPKGEIVIRVVIVLGNTGAVMALSGGDSWEITITNSSL